MALEMKPAMTPQQELMTSDSRGAFALYRDMAVGNASLLHFLGYELLTVLFSNLPGLPGLAVRSLAYPLLFGACGRRPAIGRAVMMRGPRKIFLGDKVIIDDLCVLDARGEGAEIRLGSYASIGRFSTIAAKGGRIEIAQGANVGSYCRIATQSRLSIGASTLVAAYCYLGPGNHQAGDEQAPLIARPMEIKGGVSIGSHVWIGAHSTILDGVTVGDRAIIGAHSLVREDVPAGAVVAGVPARVVRSSAGD